MLKTQQTVFEKALTSAHSSPVPKLELKKILTSRLENSPLLEGSSKPKTSHQVYHIEDDQLELDESELNELGINMQVYLRFLKSLSLRGHG